MNSTVPSDTPLQPGESLSLGSPHSSSATDFKQLSGERRKGWKNISADKSSYRQNLGIHPRNFLPRACKLHPSLVLCDNVHCAHTLTQGFASWSGATTHSQRPCRRRRSDPQRADCPSTVSTPCEQSAHAVLGAHWELTGTGDTITVQGGERG